jgi:hypothetical protein
MVNATINKSLDINQFHKGFGHCGFEMLRSTAKIHNLKIFEETKNYEDCALLKENQKSFNKDWLGSTNISGERICY